MSAVETRGCFSGFNSIVTDDLVTLDLEPVSPEAFDHFTAKKEAAHSEQLFQNGSVFSVAAAAAFPWADHQIKRDINFQDGATSAATSKEASYQCGNKCRSIVKLPWKRWPNHGAVPYLERRFGIAVPTKSRQSTQQILEKKYSVKQELEEDDRSGGDTGGCEVGFSGASTSGSMSTAVLEAFTEKTDVKKENGEKPILICVDFEGDAGQSEAEESACYTESLKHRAGALEYIKEEAESDFSAAAHKSKRMKPFVPSTPKEIAFFADFESLVNKSMGWDS